MEAKKLKRYLSPKQIHDEGVLPWSPKTIERKIKNEGLPAIRGGDGPRPGWLIDLDDLDRWMKGRKVYDGESA